MRTPKYQYSLSIGTLCPINSKIPGCSKTPPTARAPHFEIPKDISLSFAHFSTTSRFSPRPTSESASNIKPSAIKRPSILTLFTGTNAKFSLTLSKISLMKILNRLGDIGDPFLTPLSTLIKGDNKVPILTPASGDL
ncbi:hypothetical protein AYI69_g4891 [Smittium culicis]|uniref:Uncharacterized protein n=1 Tax=Smittium culicis TaxID=133412 RepID=A0A1R1Y9T6_9FUNG|nr:hypothetical protein AYI69_g4891 [Smittium culicis]